jgi:hypothetical protein
MWATSLMLELLNKLLIFGVFGSIGAHNVFGVAVTYMHVHPMFTHSMFAYLCSMYLYAIVYVSNVCAAVAGFLGATDAHKLSYNSMST